MDSTEYEKQTLKNVHNKYFVNVFGGFFIAKCIYAADVAHVWVDLFYFLCTINVFISLILYFFTHLCYRLSKSTWIVTQFVFPGIAFVWCIG